LTAKHGKLLSGNTKVEKLHVSKHSAGHQQGGTGTKNESQQSHMVSEEPDNLMTLSADDGWSQSSQRPDIVKCKVTCDEKSSKRDAADIVVRLLTPYYKSHRFGSKVQTHAHIQPFYGSLNFV